MSDPHFTGTASLVPDGIGESRSSGLKYRTEGPDLHPSLFRITLVTALTPVRAPLVSSQISRKRYTSRTTTPSNNTCLGSDQRGFFGWHID